MTTESEGEPNKSCMSCKHLHVKMTDYPCKGCRGLWGFYRWKPKEKSEDTEDDT